MKRAIQIVVIAVLLGIYCAVAVAVLHPHVSAAYRAFFIARTSSDYDPQHYDSTPEQGMIFNRPGLPSWVQTTHGLSVRDDWGRWTDANLPAAAGLHFNREFEGTLCVDTVLRAVPWVVGDTIWLRMDGQQQPIHIDSQGPTDYRVQLLGVHGAEELDFLLPPKLPAVSERAPDSADARRLGINIASVKLIPGECASTKNGNSQ